MTVSRYAGGHGSQSSVIIVNPGPTLITAFGRGQQCCLHPYEMTDPKRSCMREVPADVGKKMIENDGHILVELPGAFVLCNTGQALTVRETAGAGPRAVGLDAQ